MFGRVRRAALAACPDTPIRAYGLLHSYNAQTASNLVAVGMGAAAIGSGAGMVTLPDGRQLSAVSQAIDTVLHAGRSEQRHYVTLPGHVLAVVTADEVQLWRWNNASILGARVAAWPHSSYTAHRVDYGSHQIGARIVLDSGLIAVLTGTEGRHGVDETLDAIVSAARVPAR